MDLLARRPHFRAELRAKLRQRGFDDDEVESALDNLTEQRLLDDARTAREFVEFRLQREPVGKRRLLAELARKGAPEEAARDAVDEATEDDDREAALQAAERWLMRTTTVSREKLARHLQRRGFSPPAIVHVLQEQADALAVDP